MEVTFQNNEKGGICMQYLYSDLFITMLYLLIKKSFLLFL